MPRVFQPVANTVEITVQGTVDAQLVENKYYAKGTSAITSIMVAALASAVESWVASDFLPILSDAYTHTRVIARDLTTEASFESVDATHGGETGGISGAFLPNNVSVAIHRDTGLSGKKAKSRIYWPVLTEAQRAGANGLATVAATAFLGALDALRGDIIADTSNTWTYGYVQRVIDGVKLSAGNFIVVLSHSLTDTILDSMRARLPGHGL